MTDPSDAPYTFRTSDGADFGHGEQSWRSPLRYGDGSERARSRLQWRLCGAVVQNEYARAVVHLIQGPGPVYRTFSDLAEAWHLEPKWLGKVLRGEVDMRAADLAAVVLILSAAVMGKHPDAWVPTRAMLAEAMRGAMLQISTKPGKKHLPVSPSSLLGYLGADREAFDAAQGEPTDADIAVLNWLGEKGRTLVETPPTDRERAGLARNELLAPGPAERAGVRLRQDPRRFHRSQWTGVTDNDVAVLRAWPARVPHAAGGLHPEGMDFTLWLLPDWAETVHDEGLAEVDGWFVCAVGAPDADGRPTVAYVLDLLPMNGRHGWDDDDGRPVDEWLFQVGVATLGRTEDDRPMIVGAPRPHSG